jgi:hypothetical protein
VEAAEKSIDGIERPSAAKAGSEKVAVIAAVNRCATQKQEAKSRFSAAPEGAIDNTIPLVCLKAYPDTNREFFLSLLEGVRDGNSVLPRGCIHG